MANIPYSPIHGGRERSLNRGPLPGMLRSPASRPPIGPVALSANLVSSHRPPVAGGGLIGGPGGAAAAAGGGDPYDFGADPILQKIQAIATQERQNALAQALAARKQLAIAYGDTAGILEGDQFDQSTADAAHNNPFSILAELQRNYGEHSRHLDENLNSQNLFYSGERARQLGLSAEDLQRQRYAASGRVLGQVGDIQSSLASALMGADQQDAQAMAEAEARAQQRAQQYGYDPGAGGGAAPGGSAFLNQFHPTGSAITPGVSTPALAPARPPAVTPSTLLQALAAAGSRNRARY